MKREFLGKVLQTIYLDVFVRDNSSVWIHQTGSKEMTQKTFIVGQHDLQDIFHYLENKIHPRYTKIIIDANHDIKKLVMKWIDEKYNNYVRGAKDDFGEIVS